MANEIVYYPSDSNDYFYQSSVPTESAGIFSVGKTSLGYIHDGALRFPNIPIGQGVTVSYAQIDLYTSIKGDGTSGNMRFKVYGDDEDNAASFTTNPFGRAYTTAFSTSVDAMPNVGAYRSVGITAVVNEILARGSWANGNAMAFFMKDNGSDTGYYIDDSDTNYSRLIIRVSAAPNLKPTPVTISAPTFPSATDYGIRISEPGTDVKTATESQLYFTSRKKEFRAITEQKLTLRNTPPLNNTITHGLSYIPSSLGYFYDGTDLRKMNWGQPSNKTRSAYLQANTTDVIVWTVNMTPAGSAYVYVFIDPLS